jgi:hypothetical protein
MVVPACSYDNALRSDPKAWAPAKIESPANAGPDAAPTVTPDAALVDCSQEPLFDPDLRQSSESTLSHRAGESCLGGCHEAGGAAQLAFAAAGTIYRALGSPLVALAGDTIDGVGGTRLTIDLCGNFYAVEEALAFPVRRTQPWVENPTFRRMDQLMSRVSNPGDCAQSKCHDLGEGKNSAIYY